MPCDIITFPGGRIPSPPDPAVAAVDLCEGDPDRLFKLASASLTIARGSDSIITDPTATQCMQTAFIALSELLNLTGEARP